MRGEVTIVMSGHGRGEVFIDGEKVKGVKAVHFDGAVNTANLVRLDIQPEKVVVDGVAFFDTTAIDSRWTEYVPVRPLSRELRMSYD